MAVRSVQPLVQAAPRDRRIAGWRRIAALNRRGWRHRRGAASSGRWRRQGALGLPVRDILLIARGTWPGRQVGRFAAGPVRPMIGNVAGKLGACPKGCAKTEAGAERCQSQKVLLEWLPKYHATCWVSPSARGMG